MPKKGGKKKKDDGAEPPHDASWVRTVESGIWEKAVTDLPDANTWPTWGALRERVLTACKEVKVVNTASLRDAFTNEVVKLSPPELALVDIHGSSNLRNFTLSPMTACPKLETLDLSACANLEYVLVQSQSLKTLNLSKCPTLKKASLHGHAEALVHCPHLSKIVITDCPQLETVMLWSNELSELDMSGCVSMSSVKLQCPGLGDSTTKIPPLKEEPKHVKPSHPPIARMLKDNLLGSAATTAEAKDAAWASSGGESIIPHVHRPF